MPHRAVIAVLGILALMIPLTTCGRSSEQADEPDTTESTGPSDGKEPTYSEDLPADVAADLVGTEWTLVSSYGRPPDGTNITLNVDERDVGGFAGCNSYGIRGVTMNEGALKVRGGVRNTAVGCPGGVGQQEETYFAALADVASYRVQDGRLEIQNALGETTLVFAEREQRYMNPADLVGTAWKLDSVNGVLQLRAPRPSSTSLRRVGSGGTGGAAATPAVTRPRATTL